MQSSKAIETGIIVGIIWAVVQFGLSEGCYRLAMFLDGTGIHGPTDALYVVSDAVAWPAYQIYNGEEKSKVISELRALPVKEITSEDGETVVLENLITKIEAESIDDYEYMGQAYDILDYKGIYPEVSLATEYTIYGGVCLAWGALVGVITAFVIILNGGSRQQSWSRELGRD